MLVNLWQDVSSSVIRELLEVDVKGMMLSVAQRNVGDGWRKEMHEKPKILMMTLIVECE